MGKIYTGNKVVPKPYVREVEIFPSEGGGLKVKVHVSVTKNWKSAGAKIALSIARISDESVFGEFTISRDSRHKILYSTFNACSTKNKEILTQYSTSKNADYTTEVKTISLDEKSKTNGVFVTFTEEFLIPETNPKHLSFFIMSKLSNFDYNNPRRINTHTQIASELVIKDGKVVNTANIFTPYPGTKGSNKGHFVKGGLTYVWSGPAHFHGSKPTPSGYRGWMGGTKHHGSNQPKLAVMKVANTKIKDYRVLHNFEKINMNLDAVSGNSKNYNKLTNYTSKNAVFSDMLFSTEQNGSCNAVFHVDWAELLMQHAQFPIFFSKIDDFGLRVLDPNKPMAPVAMANCKIKNMTLLRKKMDVKEPEKQELEPVATMIEHTDALNFGHNTGMPGTSKTYSAKDLIPSAEKGVFEYVLEIEIEDGTSKHLSGLYNNLNNNYQKLVDYEKAYTPGKGTALYDQGGTFPWTSALHSLVSIVQATTDDERFKIKDDSIEGTASPREVASMARDMTYMLHPKTATTKSISKVIETYKNTFNRFETTLKGLPGLQTEKASSLKSTVGKGNKLRSKTIKILHTFKQNYDNRNLESAGYEYLNFSGENTQTIQNIDLDVYLERAYFETGRFFSPEIVESRDRKILANTDFESTLNSAEVSYLTPLRLGTANETFNLYNSLGHTMVEDDYVEHLSKISHFKSGATVSLKVPKNIKAKEESEGEDCEERNNVNVANLSTNAHLLSYAMQKNITISDVKPTFFCEDYDGEILVQSLLTTAENDRLTAATDKEDIREELHLKTETHYGTVFKPMLMQDAKVGDEKCKLKAKLSPSSKGFRLSTSQFKRLPNQLKSIVTGELKPNEVLYPSFVKGIDDNASFITRHKNIVAVEYLHHFDKDSIKSPNWHTLTKEELMLLKESGKKNILCRLRNYENCDIDYFQNKFLELPIHNEYFFMDISSPTQRGGSNSRGIPTEARVAKTTMADVTLNLQPPTELMWTNIPSSDRRVVHPAKTKSTRRAGSMTSTGTTTRDRGGY